MLTLNSIYGKLRKHNRKNYLLYIICNFMALLLITAYSAMMFSPTVQNVFPEGGDSRKQMIAVFLLSCFGCIVFTVYGASLFYRTKSKETGLFIALGTPGKQLKKFLLTEVLLLGGVSSFAGAALGIPFAWLIWNIFSLFVKSSEMALAFDLHCLLVSLLFMIVSSFFAFLLGLRFLKRVNVMDIINESHKNEPLPRVKSWYGFAGIILLLTGAVLGYGKTGFFINVLHRYPPAWTNLLYLPVFAGLYMILLHTVVHGWQIRRKNLYKGIISRSMMKFQGKQIVNNMLVITVLIAGGCFAIFYLPMLWISSSMESSSRTNSYIYHYRQDQELPGQKEVSQLAEKYGLSIKSWKSVPFINLASDGEKRIEEEDGKFHYEYTPMLSESNFFSESSFELLTGISVDIPSGIYCPITNQEEQHSYTLSSSFTKLTNPITEDTLTVAFGDYLHYNDLSGMVSYYVLDDEDYEAISQGLTDQWKEVMVFFNLKEKDNFAFAEELYNRIVNDTASNCEIPYYYDRIEKITAEEKGEVYWGDTEDMTQISFDQRDTSNFRMYWKYIPKFRILDQQDFFNTFAVFLMMFLFISIICMMAAMIIGYTRCITISVNNRYVFEDLKRLGASPRYLLREIKSQASKVFFAPSAVGLSIMYLLFSMIMLANDGRITSSEIYGLGGCFVLIIIFAFIIWLVYRFTLQKMIHSLHL
ncbi:MAG: FtsX-like permease family protein [Ruminococcus sp.]|jgi:putative ABC transport system permease protein